MPNKRSRSVNRNNRAAVPLESDERVDTGTLQRPASIADRAQQGTLESTSKRRTDDVVVSGLCNELQALSDHIDK